MAKKETLDAGKNIFERALAKLPKEQQDTLNALMGNEEFVATIGEHGLMREDYSRLADAAKLEAEKAKSLYDQNLAWREERITTLAKADEAISTLEKMKAAGVKIDGDGTTTTTTPSAPSGLTKEEVEKLIQGKVTATELQGISFMSTLTDIGLGHFAEFKEKLNTKEVIKLAQEKGLTLEGAYDSLVVDRRKARAEEDIQRRLKEAEQKGFESAMTKASSAPYPIGGGTPGGAPTTLSGLKKDTTGKNDFGVDAAVAAFNKSRLGAT